MKTSYIILFSLLFNCSASFAVTSLPRQLIPISSSSGMALVKKDLNPNLVKLLSHFVTQKTVTYCGVASVVMILNSTSMDEPLDSLHPPYHYFTQDNFFTDKVKKIITPEAVLKHGITLTQLYQIVEVYGLNAKVFYADKLNVNKFRQLVKTAIANQQFVIVNFLRTGIEEEGSGHHSPLAAYDEKNDRFLMLDVARYKYPSYWVKTVDLWNAVNTLDGKTSRGIIIIRPHL